MVRYLLAFLTVILITVKLSSAQLSLSPNTVNVIKSNNDYTTLDDAGATYTVTSNGSPVNARLIVTASAKLILDNCHILRTDEGSPITIDAPIDAPGVTLEIQIKNTNTICMDDNASDATSAIASTKTNAPTLIFAEAPNAPATSELLLRGSSTATANTPPVQLNKGGSIVFRSGTVRIATSEGGTTGLLIPALAAANTVTLCGGTVIAQICPRDGKSAATIITGDNIDVITNALFDCITFSMTGGMIATEGNPCSSSSHTLAYTSKPYDTFFAYKTARMEFITNAFTRSISGGMKRTSSKLHCYGLPPNTTYLKGSFIDNSGNLFGGTSDENGVLSLAYSTYYEGLRFNLDATSEAIAKVFNATPRPTKNGCTAKADFGISNITLNAETLYPELHLTLDLHDDPSAVLEKTVYVRIYCTVNNEDRVMIAEQPLTFTRNVAGKPFTATFTDISKARSASTTTRYTIEAYN